MCFFVVEKVRNTCGIRHSIRSGKGGKVLDYYMYIHRLIYPRNSYFHPLCPVVHTRNLAIKNARAEGPTTVLDVDGRHDRARSLLTADGTADPPEGDNPTSWELGRHLQGLSIQFAKSKLELALVDPFMRIRPFPRSSICSAHFCAEIKIRDAFRLINV